MPGIYSLSSLKQVACGDFFCFNFITSFNHVKKRVVFYFPVYLIFFFLKISSSFSVSFLSYTAINNWNVFQSYLGGYSLICDRQFEIMSLPCFGGILHSTQVLNLLSIITCCHGLILAKCQAITEVDCSLSFAAVDQRKGKKINKGRMS